MCIQQLAPFKEKKGKLFVLQILSLYEFYVIWKKYTCNINVPENNINCRQDFYTGNIDLKLPVLT